MRRVNAQPRNAEVLAALLPSWIHCFGGTASP
jgi:hypothetical protein